MIFLVDHFFEENHLQIEFQYGKDRVIFVDVTYEPKTTYVDKLATD